MAIQAIEGVIDLRDHEAHPASTSGEVLEVVLDFLNCNQRGLPPKPLLLQAGRSFWSSDWTRSRSPAFPSTHFISIPPPRASTASATSTRSVGES